MRLWTIQHRDFIDTQDKPGLTADWRLTPQNWRCAYRWMAQQWINRVGPDLKSAPIWCWHSCDGQLGAPPTVGTAASLMGDWGYYAPWMKLVELDVPDALALLSSYSQWNEALDEFIDRRADSIDTAKFASMFDEPLIKHDTDDIQAVIPHIMRQWIVDIRLLPQTDDDWEAAI